MGTCKSPRGMWNRSVPSSCKFFIFQVKLKTMHIHIKCTKTKAKRKLTYLLSICISVQFSNMMTFFHTGMILTIKKPPTKSLTWVGICRVTWQRTNLKVEKEYIYIDMQVGYIYKHCMYVVCEIYIYLHTQRHRIITEKFWFSSIFVKEKHQWNSINSIWFFLKVSFEFRST